MCESSAVRAVALLGPVAKEHHVRQFEVPGVNLFTGNELDPTDQPDAALIFGGDGTIHRHLGGLALKQIPTLIVPLGSANDFARSIGIETVEQALAAWRRFCASGDNMRSIDLGTIEPLDERSRSRRRGPRSLAGRVAGVVALRPRRSAARPRVGSEGRIGPTHYAIAVAPPGRGRTRGRANHVFRLHRRHRTGRGGESPDPEAAAMAARAWRIRARAAASAGRLSSAAHHGVGRSGRPLGDARGRARLPDRRRQRAAIRPRHAADPRGAHGRWPARYLFCADVEQAAPAAAVSGRSIAARTSA